MNRSLYFGLERETTLTPAAAMDHAVLEVLAVPEEYTDAAARQIAETVFSTGAIENRARVGSQGGPIRITWEALVERGLAAGVLDQEDA